jgi:hypothetical protein
MLVTGIQAVGSKGVTAVQGTVVDTSESTRAGFDADPDAKRAASGRTRPGDPQPGDPQPVVFPRKGLPVDHRPVALRHKHAAARYRSDGGNHDNAA